MSNFRLNKVQRVSPQPPVRSGPNLHHWIARARLQVLKQNSAIVMHRLGRNSSWREVHPQFINDDVFLIKKDEV
jgi:hypothetical protein